MKEQHRIIEKKEFVHLKRILDISSYGEDKEKKQAISQLKKELQTAIILDEQDMPKDIIRLAHEVHISMNNGWSSRLQVVAPSNKDPASYKISILTPMGAALIGRAKNESFTCVLPSGKKQIHVDNVISPRRKQHAKTTLKNL